MRKCSRMPTAKSNRPMGLAGAEGPRKFSPEFALWADWPDGLGTHLTR
jgi:hypothetical protein